MNPREAGRITIELEEPNWRELFEEQCARWPTLPRYLQEDNAFEEVLRRWRRFNSTPVEVNGEWKRRPAPATDAIIALAKLKVMAPRSAWNEIPHGDVVEGYQHDDHMWMSYSGEQWRIVAIEDRMLHLEKMWFSEKQREIKTIDLNRARWDGYVDAAVAVLSNLVLDN
jgi:hypothetical protein